MDLDDLMEFDPVVMGITLIGSAIGLAWVYGVLPFTIMSFEFPLFSQILLTITIPICMYVVSYIIVNKD